MVVTANAPEYEERNHMLRKEEKAIAATAIQSPFKTPDLDALGKEAAQTIKRPSVGRLIWEMMTAFCRGPRT